MTTDKERKAAMTECEPCEQFFARFTCGKHFGECDCPRCQGYCQCPPESDADRERAEFFAKFGCD